MSKKRKDPNKQVVVADVGLDKLGAALSRFADSAERLLDATDGRRNDSGKKQTEDWFILGGGHDSSKR